MFWNLAEKSGEFLFLARAQAKLDNIDGKMSFSINRFDKIRFIVTRVIMMTGEFPNLESI